jgi:hypothetical protein
MEETFSHCFKKKGKTCWDFAFVIRGDTFYSAGVSVAD